MLHGQESAISRWDLAVSGRNDNAPRKSAFGKLRLKFPKTPFQGSWHLELREAVSSHLHWGLIEVADNFVLDQFEIWRIQNR
jgi:hypothetical protein